MGANRQPLTEIVLRQLLRNRNLADDRRYNHVSQEAQRLYQGSRTIHPTVKALTDYYRLLRHVVSDAQATIVAARYMTGDRALPLFDHRDLASAQQHVRLLNYPAAPQLIENHQQLVRQCSRHIFELKRKLLQWRGHEYDQLSSWLEVVTDVLNREDKTPETLFANELLVDEIYRRTLTQAEYAAILTFEICHGLAPITQEQLPDGPPSMLARAFSRLSVILRLQDAHERHSASEDTQHYIDTAMIAIQAEADRVWQRQAP